MLVCTHHNATRALQGPPAPGPGPLNSSKPKVASLRKKRARQWKVNGTVLQPLCSPPHLSRRSTATSTRRTATTITPPPYRIAFAASPLHRFATSPLTCLRSASYHSSPSRITSSSSSFFTLTQPPLLKLHLPPPPLHRRRAPPSEAAPSQIFVLALLPSCFTMHWPNVPFSTAAACLHSVAPRSQSLAAIARRSCSSLVLVLVCSCLTCTCAHSTLRSQYTCPESCAYHSALLHNIEHCFILYCIYCTVLLHRDTEYCFILHCFILY